MVIIKQKREADRKIRVLSRDVNGLKFRICRFYDLELRTKKALKLKKLVTADPVLLMLVPRLRMKSMNQR